MKRLTTTILLIICLIMLLCMSCDGPPKIRWMKPNFIWGKSSSAPMNQYVEGWYCKIGHDYFAVLEWNGTGQLAKESIKVALCLEENVLSDTNIVYSLHSGMVLFKGLYDKNMVIKSMGFLTNDNFAGERLSAHTIRLTYNGELSDRANYIDRCYDFTGNWLQFDVKAKEDSDSVISVMKEIYPLLEKEENAGAIMECITPLVKESSK